ncbi:MAG: hypothetical protein A2694_00195 [Candidatus Blackburnbacteria bacterium RIFCSPHIGHO2_01_FULL_40_17]|uniref:Glycosyltransferase RgtA/B/C/D-like domain-containing protein n=1 Tax=Candidatus Blackburnbacteria bacterium RIFCSPLOWO2_01_FULL_40_20 TaxID=1797519 RepID=A0A1G1VEU0_9BACT|nr:MAG: hypothetical protein A2694_00195 [Candidatus Blackburnbacteria bacterium RIFCSPHIGHO2_01_FULL_40_17]OGY13881.1 MAG: hypothetical protein A3A77_01120 [Candidatus Blackburnbacteria bacterium RIFCSPLOWO2_01_FULL_40_20]OGY14950.1 MAG: hypothetical protein A3I52_02770 [Candidatus Blackburnbacteria bacterium RIFCSPLOWO2_02_FULL_40_10]HBL51717.1 hypothetical protein [Candidatus Blackburnbacteria bacterium]
MWRKNLLFIIAVVLVSQFLVHLPDYLRWKNTPSDLWFTGQVSWFDPWDLNVYFGAVGWGERAGLLFQNLYDGHASAPLYIFTVYTLLGKLLGSFDLSNAAIFHIGTVFLNFVLAPILWWFIKIFLEKDVERKIAFFLIYFGGGLGWLFFPNMVLPDLGQPGFIFESATRRPHEAVSVSFILLSLGGLWIGTVYRKSKYFVLSAISLLGAFYLHPYTVLPLSLIVSIFGLYQWLKNKDKSFWKAVLTIGISGFVYLVLFGRHLIGESSFAGLQGQVQFSANPLYAVLGWGILFPFIVTIIITPTSRKEISFMKFWFVIQFVSMYLPLGFQKLLGRGLWIDAVMLGVIGVGLFVKKVNLQYKFLLILTIALASISPLFIFAKKISEPAGNRWIYITSDEKKVIDYLDINGKNEELVLASYRLSNIIPANTKKRVYAGHEYQTPDFKSRITQVNKFYSGGMNDQEAKDFLNGLNTTWVFWGPDEKVIGGISKIPNLELLEPVIEEKEASLYKIKKL